MNKTGIYKILCIETNKCYIGSSYDIKRRLQQHRYALKSNRHINRHLQNAWNKYGETAFEFLLIEETPIDKLLEREQFWINRLKSWKREYGYNKSETARPTESSLFKKSKAYIVTHPDGTEELVVNLESWERINKFLIGALGKVARGKQNTYKNYKCRFAYQTEEEWKSTLTRNKKAGAQPKFIYRIVCPDGSTIETDRISQFCKENKLSRSCMNEIINKKSGRTQHKGYTCEKVNY